MRIAVLTSLYPSSSRPFEGIFAERRWLSMLARGHEISVTQPLPLAPPAALARALGRSDWAAIAGSPKEERREGITVRRPRYLHVPGKPLSNARRFAATGARVALAGKKPEVVVADYAWPAAAAATELARREVPMVVCGRGSDVLQVREIPALASELARGLRAAAGWFGVSMDVVRAMDELGGAAGRGVLVPNGVDTDLFRPLERSWARAELRWMHPGPIVLCVGHLIERKDPVLSLEVFLRGAPPDAHLVWIGRGELRDRFLGRALERGAAERVHCLGEVQPEQLALWYGACNALLLTSRREGRPNVVLEALSSGRPVLATAAGGTAELLEGLDGMLAPTRDEGTLARELERLLRTPFDPQELRRRVADLSWRASSERLEACLERACAEAARS